MKFAISSTAVLVALAFAGPAQAQTQVVTIGHSGPLSGANAFAGKDNENGVRMAVEELNAKKIKVGGKTLEFKLDSEDDQCDARSGVSVAQKFVDDGVKFVMGPYCSGVAIPASRVYSQGGTMVSTVGTNPKVTDNGYKNLFRIIASDTQIGSNMATYAANVMKVKNVAVIDDRTAFGQGVADEFSKEAKKLGLNIVGQEFTTDKSTDFLAILTNLKAKQPE
ncbi:MAG: branched-chain amino acid ABC transporter substrate-binding protein, partial [Burkholderiales bacterium]|nr:branched-chain amino acid ABC transporter substrate-binding protein [Burkholderiales bacterium]